MEQVQCQLRDDGTLIMSGPLVFETVPDLYTRHTRELKGSGNLTIDLAGVGRADSAGLALLMEWLQLARKDQRQVQFVNVPRQLQSLARVVGLEKALGIAG